MPPKSTPVALLGETPRPHWLPKIGGRENSGSPQNWGARGAKIDFRKRSNKGRVRSTSSKRRDTTTSGNRVCNAIWDTSCPVGKISLGEIGKTENGIVVVTTHLYDGSKSTEGNENPPDIEFLKSHSPEQLAWQEAK